MIPHSLRATLQAVGETPGAGDGSLLREGLTPELQAKLLLSAGVVAVLILVRRLVLRIADRRVRDPGHLYWWSKSSGYIVFGLSVVAVA